MQKFNLKIEKDFVKSNEFSWECSAKGHKINDCAVIVLNVVSILPIKGTILLHNKLHKYDRSNSQDDTNRSTPTKESVQSHMLFFTLQNSSFLKIIPIILKLWSLDQEVDILLFQQMLA